MERFFVGSFRLGAYLLNCKKRLSPGGDDETNKLLVAVAGYVSYIFLPFYTPGLFSIKVESAFDYRLPQPDMRVLLAVGRAPTSQQVYRGNQIRFGSPARRNQSEIRGPSFALFMSHRAD